MAVAGHSLDWPQMVSSSPKTAAARLQRISALRPRLGIILGSGFQHALAGLRVDRKIACAKIPGFPQPSVSGHAGEIYFGHFGHTPALVLSGRIHFYERSADGTRDLCRARAGGIRCA